MARGYRISNISSSSHRTSKHSSFFIALWYEHRISLGIDVQSKPNESGFIITLATKTVLSECDISVILNLPEIDIPEIDFHATAEAVVIKPAESKFDLFPIGKPWGFAFLTATKEKNGRPNLKWWIRHAGWASQSLLIDQELAKRELKAEFDGEKDLTLTLKLRLTAIVEGNIISKESKFRIVIPDFGLPNSDIQHSLISKG